MNKNLKLALSLENKYWTNLPEKKRRYDRFGPTIVDKLIVIAIFLTGLFAIASFVILGWFG